MRKGQAMGKFLTPRVDYHIVTSSEEVFYPLFSSNKDHKLQSNISFYKKMSPKLFMIHGRGIRALKEMSTI